MDDDEINTYKLTGIGIPDLETHIMEEIWKELKSVCWQYDEDGDSKWIFLYPNKLQKLRKLLGRVWH